jgi:hypothetical protein
MSELKFTKTATFLFPLLDIPKKLFDCNIKDVFGRTKISNRFINAFSRNKCINKYNEKDKDYVFILVKTYQDVDFDRFYTTLQAFPNYVDDYDSKGCCIFVFKVPEKRQKDFDLIKNGKYSEVSADAKKAILMNNFFSGKPFTLPLILNKAEALKNSWEDRLSTPGSLAELKDQEVWPIIESENEELNDSIMSQITTKKELSPSGEF